MPHDQHKQMMTTRTIYILVVLLLAQPSHSQQTPTFVTAPCFAAIIVGNVDTAAIWYQSVLPLNLKSQTHEPGGFRVAVLESPEFLIELIENKAVVKPENIPAKSSGRNADTRVFQNRL
jgi:hypothetical protein